MNAAELESEIQNLAEQLEDLEVNNNYNTNTPEYKALDEQYQNLRVELNNITSPNTKYFRKIVNDEYFGYLKQYHINKRSDLVKGKSYFITSDNIKCIAIFKSFSKDPDNNKDFRATFTLTDEYINDIPQESSIPPIFPGFSARNIGNDFMITITNKQKERFKKYFLITNDVHLEEYWYSNYASSRGEPDNHINKIAYSDIYSLDVLKENMLDTKNLHHAVKSGRNTHNIYTTGLRDNVDIKRHITGFLDKGYGRRSKKNKQKKTKKRKTKRKNYYV